MTQKEMIIEAIESLGYQPYVDDDGDVCLRYQLKDIYFMTGEGDEKFVSAILFLFHKVKEGEEALALAACNKVNREIKVVKTYIDETMTSVSASFEFIYTDMESLKENVENALRILGMVRSAYHRNKVELSV